MNQPTKRQIGTALRRAGFTTTSNARQDQDAYFAFWKGETDQRPFDVWIVADGWISINGDHLPAWKIDATEMPAWINDHRAAEQAKAERIAVALADAGFALASTIEFFQTLPGHGINSSGLAYTGGNQQIHFT